MTRPDKRPSRPARTDVFCPARPSIGYVAPAWATRRFAHGPASVTLRADRYELIKDAETMLYAYTRTATGASRWTITLHTSVSIDHAATEALFTDAAAHNIGPNLHAHSISAPGGRLFWIRDHATLVHLDHTRGSVTVHARDLGSARFFAARLVRQVMTAQLLEHGAVYAHAAALEHAGQGLLIAGPKGAGKTTTVLSTLRLVGGDFVANDRLLLRRGPDDAGVVGYAWPMHLRATANTLHAVPGMDRFLPRRHNTLAGSTAPSGKTAIEPDELRAVLSGGGRVLGETRLRLMLWPFRSNRDVPPEPIPAAKVRDVLMRTQFFMHDPVTGTTSHRNHWLLPPDENRTAIALAAVADHLARSVPCLRLPVTDSPAELAARVAALLDQPITPATGSRGPR